MLSLNSFSQTDITCLPNRVLKEAAKDLVRYDGCKEEVEILSHVVNKLEERDEKKDTIIDLLKSKDKNNQYIIQQKDLQIAQYEKLSHDLTKELKGQRVKSFFWKVGAFLGVITSSYLLISK